MSASTPAAPGPRKRLPVNPSAEHLRKQAKRRANGDGSISLSDAQHQLAREYGCKSWAELMHVVETMNRGADQLQNVKREVEPLPAAVRRGDVATIRRILETGGFTQHDLDAGLAHAVWYRNPGTWDDRRAIAELMIEHGADPDGQYGSAYGPIMFGCGECLNPDGLAFLIEHGADVTFGPIDTKYGPQTPMSHVLGTYGRGGNDRKHRCIDLLLSRGAHVPAEVTPEMLAVHRGDVAALGRLIDADPDLVNRRYPDMPYGNILLRGATLLHMGVEFGEIAIIDLLLDRGASINGRADVIDGVGGQTPIYHAIAVAGGAGIPVLEHLIDHAGRWIDMDVKATFRVAGDDKPLPEPMTPLQYAEWSMSDAAPDWRRSTQREVDLLRRARAPRIDDPAFRDAVAAIDAGDVARLRELLKAHRHLATARAEESGSFAGPYFRHPALLWFVAENPVRTGKLPPNIADVAEAIIDAGATREDIDYTLGLVVSGRVPRESGVQAALIETLVRRGADAGAALTSAVMEREQEAIEVLLRLGARPDLVAAAGLGRVDDVRRHLASAPRPADDELRRALHAAAMTGQVGVIDVLLDEAGVDVNARIGHGTTALHQAAWFDRIEAVEHLLSRGADPMIRDATHNGTPAGWARHAGHADLADRLSRAAADRR